MDIIKPERLEKNLRMKIDYLNGIFNALKILFKFFITHLNATRNKKDLKNRFSFSDFFQYIRFYLLSPNDSIG